VTKTNTPAAVSGDRQALDDVSVAVARREIHLAGNVRVSVHGLNDPAGIARVDSRLVRRQRQPIGVVAGEGGGQDKEKAGGQATRGGALVKRGENVKARHCLRAAVRSAPVDPGGRCGRADAYNAVGDER